MSKQPSNQPPTWNLPFTKLQVIDTANNKVLWEAVFFINPGAQMLRDQQEFFNRNYHAVNAPTALNEIGNLRFTEFGTLNGTQQDKVSHGAITCTYSWNVTHWRPSYSAV